MALSGMPGPRLARSEVEFYMQVYKICRRKRSDNPYDNKNVRERIYLHNPYEIINF